MNTMTNTVLTETKSVRKWGNGLGVLIPAKVANTLDLTAGDDLLMHLTDQNTLVLEKKETKRPVPVFNIRHIAEKHNFQLINKNRKPIDIEPMGKEVF